MFIDNLYVNINTNPIDLLFIRFRLKLVRMSDKGANDSVSTQASIGNDSIARTDTYIAVLLPKSVLNNSNLDNSQNTSVEGKIY